MNRLQKQVASMVALEDQIESSLAQILELGVAHSDAAALLRRIHVTAGNHRAALDARLQAITATEGAGSGSEASATAPATGNLSRSIDGGSATSVSSALHAVQTMLNNAVFGYAILQPLTHRYLDSKTGGGENTGDVSNQHTHAYAAASREINQLIHDVVLWELTRAGDECRCTCPSCSLGVCLCSVTSRTILNSAWADAAPVGRDGVLVQSPRSGSAAASAGLQSGDIVLAADGQPIHASPDLQGIVREHQPGEDITLQVRRDGSATLDIVVTRP